MTVFLSLVRHGQSQWNLENRFTGWVDVELSPLGESEASSAGVRMKDVPVDVVYTSDLKRAQNTMKLAMAAAGKKDFPVIADAALNERHYGDLQGKNKAETAQEFGEEQVKIWRRSFDVPPPGGESLKDTLDRAWPYFEKAIAPQLKAGKNVAIFAHGNSLRALIMQLEGMTPDQILQYELATATPVIYELDANLKIVNKKVLEPQKA
jgi:2,3-bisphosphoglycerate-dependent phosphoglycerate mutase